MSPEPITVQWVDNTTQATLRVDRQQVLLPGDCVTATWQASGVQGVAFFPVVVPGFPGEAGVRRNIAGASYETLPPEAPGATIIHSPNGEPITGEEQACIDLNSSPKLRIYLDESAPVLRTRVDVVFLRLETWLVLLGAGLLMVAGDVACPRSAPPLALVLLRGGLLASALLLLFYAWVFIDFGLGDFLATYWLDVPVFGLLLFANVGAATFCLLRPYRCLRLWVRIRRRLRSLPRVVVWIGVFTFWVWALAFGYAGQYTITPYLWLPFFLWAAAWGTVVMLCAGGRPDSVESPSQHRIDARWIAVAAVVLSLSVNLLLLWGYGVLPGEDAASYLRPAESLMDGDPAAQAQNLPRRTFPLLLTVWITRAPDNPLVLILLQIVLAAVAVGALTYVLARRYRLLAIVTAVLLATNQTWALYSRQVMSESLFISFSVLSLAVLIAHHDRRYALSLWSVLLAGMLFAWGLMMRSALVILIVPLSLVYAWMSRSWRHGVALLIGAGIILVTIAGFNRWRYGTFGLIGPQYDTLVSALFSYPGFDPEAGPESAALDADLRECMPYLDYDDVPRYQNTFIYQHFNPCLHETSVTAEDREALDARVNAAFRERVRHDPLTFARLLIEESGTLLSFAVSEELEPIIAVDGFQCHNYAWCADVPSAHLPADQPMIRTMNRLSAIPTQAYLAGTVLSSRSGAVSLGAFAIWVLFLLVVAPTHLRLIVVICVSFIVVYAGSTLLVHTFKPRYTVVLLPFYALLSGITVVVLWRELAATWRSLARLPLIILIALIGGYGLFAQPDLRRSVTLPVGSAVLPETNLLRKYNFDQDEYRIAVALIRRGRAFAPGAVEAVSDLYETGIINMARDLHFKQAYALRGWSFTRQPGYLHDMGYTHLLVDPQFWDALPPEDQATLNDPARYALQAKEGGYRLYRAVGFQRETYPAYDANDLVVYADGDGLLDVYVLDANRSGQFITRIDTAALTSGQNSVPAEDGWRVTADCDATICTLVVEAPDGQPMDSGFRFPVSSWEP